MKFFTRNIHLAGLSYQTFMILQAVQHWMWEFYLLYRIYWHKSPFIILWDDGWITEQSCKFIVYKHQWFLSRPIIHNMIAIMYRDSMCLVAGWVPVGARLWLGDKGVYRLSIHRYLNTLVLGMAVKSLNVRKVASFKYTLNLMEHVQIRSGMLYLFFKQFSQFMRCFHSCAVDSDIEDINMSLLPKVYMGCNYLSLPLIYASHTQVHIFSNA